MSILIQPLAANYTSKYMHHDAVQEGVCGPSADRGGPARQDASLRRGQEDGGQRPRSVASARSNASGSLGRDWPVLMY